MDKETLIECLEALEGETIDRIIPDYSGRFMYGKKCLGITTDSEWETAISIAKWLFNNYPDEAEDILNALKDCRYDSLGRKTVVYFPSIQFGYDEEEEEETEE